MSKSKPIEAYTAIQPSQGLDGFAHDLKTALNASLQSSGSHYERVSVLALRWENDDNGLDALQNQLLEIFVRKYHYTTETHTIPVVHSTNLLMTKLSTWSYKNSGPRTLRIFVYSGHASGAGTQDTAWYIGGKADSYGNLVGPQIDWSRVNAGIETMAGDICYIFDCCSAGSLAMRDGAETVAATGWDQTAGASLNFSFTQAFIDVLMDLDGKPDTLAGIYSRIFRRAHQNQVSSCPVHIPKIGSPSVTIAPLGSGPAVTRKQARTEHRVLLSVRLSSGPTPGDLGEWKKWLIQNIPSEVVSVDV